MRRALVSVLLAVFSFPLIAPVLLARTDADLPACCRRAGQHHCAMADHSSGIGIRSIQPNCPLFPKAGAAAVSLHDGLPGASARIVAPAVLRSVNWTTDDNTPRIAPRGSSPKRGPPSNLDQAF